MTYFFRKIIINFLKKSLWIRKVHAREISNNKQKSSRSSTIPDYKNYYQNSI